MQNHPKYGHKNLCLTTKGVIEIVPDRMFSALLSNFGNRPFHLPKHTVFVLALPSLTHILTLGRLSQKRPKLRKGVVR